MKKILVFNVNWMGDVIFSTPVFKALKESYPDAKISCIAVPSVHDVLEMNPYVDEILTYDEKGQHRTPLEKLKLILGLRRQKFDVAFLLHRSWTRACLVFLAGIPRRVGYNEKQRGIFLTHKVNPPLRWGHRVEHYLHVIESFGIKVNDRDYDLCVADEEKQKMTQRLQSEGVEPKDFLAVVNPGGNWHLKRWTEEHFIEFIERLSKEQGAKVVISGSEKDVELADRIARRTAVKPLVWAGKTRLKELAALMQRADIVISADTGPLHLASSTGTNVIGLFGPTRPEVTGPRGKGKLLILSHDVECNNEPCYNLQCPDNICMQSITADDVLRGVAAMLKSPVSPEFKHALEDSKNLSNKPLARAQIRSILVISLTNIGDVILTFPVIDVLRRDFSHARLSVVVGPKNESMVKRNPHMQKVYVFDKKQSGFKKLSWLLDLKKEHFDLIVDLRNTAIPFLIKTKYRTSPTVRLPISHMKQKHLNRLKSIYSFISEAKERYSIHIAEEDKDYVERLISGHLKNRENFIVVGPGAADRLKRWTEEGFAKVCDQLIKAHHLRVIMVGDEKDHEVAERILVRMSHSALNVCGRTNLVQLAELLKRSQLAIVNDSGVMHMASYLNVPVVAIFGPTDPALYGPWSSQSTVIRKNTGCRPCRDPDSPALHTCMSAISAEDVLKLIKFPANKGLDIAKA